ncbi:putative penicillolysin/deuterolysin metalloprotease [Aspergillus ruber CBS 135680]|uniref:Neutral protease 2 n=1 Tax=Aspergillus ruber (strain CBS 135680) TaxID=1388766 RepID=A0A017S482_ASPRC|nr:zincin [Aspergillus ruber CBS 135680]EYE90985.1 zincin [Aspergillus ruber CBS 135680]
MPYSSNELTVGIDASEAKTVSKARPIGKARAITTCSPDRQAIVDTALADTVELANAAADAATSGDVAYVAKEAGSTSDNIKHYCTDPWSEQGSCRKNFLAHEWAQYSMIVNCEIYYTLLMTGLPTVREGQDEATTAVHEFTHLPAVYDPPTSDFRYGNEVLLLESEQALENADNYATYATAVYLNCSLAA